MLFGPALVQAAVKAVARDVLLQNMVLPGGGPNTNFPLGTVLRTAFHDAGTYNRATNQGGANGSLRFEGNLTQSAGLPPGLQAIEVRPKIVCP